MTDDLVKRLREADIYDYDTANEICNEAADRIEALEQSLTFAAGIIAAIEPLYDGPEQVLKILTAEGKGMAAALGEKKDG